MRKREIIERIERLENRMDFATEQHGRAEGGILGVILHVVNTIKRMDELCSNRMKSVLFYLSTTDLLDALEGKVFGKKPRPAK
jgi:hypothetical protein